MPVLGSTSRDFHRPRTGPVYKLGSGLKPIYKLKLKTSSKFDLLQVKTFVETENQISDSIKPMAFQVVLLGLSLV